MKELQEYEKACNNLKDAFLKSLYPNEPEYSEDEFWVGDEVGGVLSCCDWFVGIDVMAGYFRYKFTPEMFFDWYDQWVGAAGNLNMKNFKYKTTIYGKNNYT